MNDHLDTPNHHRFWLKSYEQGVPHDIDSSLYSSLADFLNDVCTRYTDNIAFSNFGTRLTFGDINQLSRHFAAYLQQHLNLAPGSRIAIMMPNILQYPIALLGALRGGYTVVNVDPMYTARELIYQLNNAEADVLIFTENFADVVEQALPQLSLKQLLSTKIGDLLGFPKSLLLNMVIKHVKKMIPPHQLTNTLSFSRALSIGKKLSFYPVEIDHNDIAFLQYTGGTTGVSKGAILTHGNMVSNILQAKTWAQQLLLSGEEKIITALPLYHIFSLTANCFFMMSIAGENVLITNPRDFNGFVKLIRNEGFTVITGVNTLFRKLLDAPDFDNIDFSRLKLTFGAGMAVTEDVATEWQQRTGCAITEAYGLTETSPAACINPFYLKSFSGYIGLPIASTWIQIKDNAGNDLGIDTPGELCIKGPQVTQGYWHKPELNAECFTDDGYFRTGDIATINAEGFIKLLDRKKDMILVSGFNVYPNEIDNIISQHPDVSEAAAIGIPDSITGEAIKVFVVRNNPQLTKEVLIEYCTQQLTGYKRPSIIEFVEELPKSNVGKILRKALR